MIDEMLEAAKKATPGPWVVVDGNNVQEAWVCVQGEEDDNSIALVTNEPGDTRFIAACSPERIIALCEFAKAFTAWHDHKDAYSHAYETAYTEMVMAWRRLL